jgi:hypothetical protein
MLVMFLRNSNHMDYWTCIYLLDGEAVCATMLASLPVSYQFFIAHEIRAHRLKRTRGETRSNVPLT